VDGAAKTRFNLPFTTWLTSGSTVSWEYSNKVTKTSEASIWYIWSSTSGLSQSGKSGTLTVTAAGTVTAAYNTQTVTHFLVSVPASTTAGSPFTVTVTAKDDAEQTATGYTGTIHFGSTDPAAGITLPSSYTFTASDNGAHTFTSGVTLKTAGSQTILVSDLTYGWVGISDTISVGSASATQLSISVPASTTAGTSFDITVTAKDTYGNVASDYLGTVHFTSSDASASVV
jgi:hypothetical protein